MHSNNTIQNELKELNSMLAGISNRNVYTVPDGYFDVLSHDILLAVQQGPVQQIDNTVPAGYFDGLADSIMNRIKTEESETPAFLEELKNKNTYRVPLGYFDTVADDILSKLPQPAKLIEMKGRSVFRYAAAAVVTGILGLSIISVFNKTQPGNPVATANSIPVAVLNDAKKIITENSFDKVLATVSDADIVNYLQSSGQDVNAALVASVADDNNLPDEVDYLTDDKTLDNLLSELKIEASTNN